MNRRDALKSLALLASATGISITPVTAQDAADAAVIILHTDKYFSCEEAARFKAAWDEACRGTDLAGVKTFVLSDGMTFEIVRARGRV